MTFSRAAASMTGRSMASVSRQTSASLSATRARSSSAGIAASPVYRSTSADLVEPGEHRRGKPAGDENGWHRFGVAPLSGALRLCTRTA